MTGTVHAQPETGRECPYLADRWCNKCGWVSTVPRTWVIEMPAGMELLNANDRSGHWGRRKRLTEELRAAAGWLAKGQRIPRLERAHVLGIYEPPDRRRRDPSNYLPSFKACIDGIVQDAGVLSDDDAAHVDGPDMRLGSVHPGGRLILIITEVTG